VVSSLSLLLLAFVGPPLLFRVKAVEVGPRIGAVVPANDMLAPPAPAALRLNDGPGPANGAPDAAWLLWKDFSAVEALAVKAVKAPAQQSSGQRVALPVQSTAAREAARRIAPDIFDLLPASGFSADFKAPCWTGADGKLQCLPAYFLLGVFQCGVRDLHERVALHPDVAATANAMPHFWDELHPFREYLTTMQPAVARVQAAPMQTVFGDASFSTFTYTWTGSARLSVEWAKVMKECRETCSNNNTCIDATCYTHTNTVAPPLAGGGANITLPRLLAQVYAKHAPRLVVILRDPVERLHAAFHNYFHYGAKYGASETGFSAFAREMVGHLRQCLRSHSEAECVTAFEALGPEEEAVFYHADQVLKSLYAPFLEGWQAAFGDNLLVLRLEDWSTGDSNKTALRATLQRVYAHLDLTPLPEARWPEVLAAPIKRTGERKERRSQMEPDTRAFLRAFYKPYNQRLVDSLGDRKWLWEDTSVRDDE